MIIMRTMIMMKMKNTMALSDYSSKNNGDIGFETVRKLELKTQNYIKIIKCLVYKFHEANY